MAEGTPSTIISVNVTNWVTVVLMAAVGFGLLAAATKWYQSRATAA